MSAKQYKIIDSILNDYLAKYNARIPSFRDSESSFQEPQRVSRADEDPESCESQNVEQLTADKQTVHPSQDVPQIRAAREKTVRGSQRMESSDLAEYRDQLAARKPEAAENAQASSPQSVRLPDPVLSKRQLERLLNLQSTQEPSVSTVRQSGRPSGAPPRSEVRPGRRNAEMQLLDEQIRARELVKKAAKSRRAPQDDLPIPTCEFNSLNQEIQRWKKIAQARLQTIAELKKENQRLRDAAARREQTGSHNLVLQKELEGALAEIRQLKADKEKMEQVFQRILK